MGEPEGTQTGHAVKCSARFEHALGHPAGRVRGADGGRPLDAGSLGGGGVRMPGGPRPSKPVDRNPCRPRRRRSSPSPSCELMPSQLTDGCQTVSMYAPAQYQLARQIAPEPLAGSTHANGAREASLQNAIYGLNGDAVCAHRLCPYPFTAQMAGVSGVASFLGFGVPLAATASRLPCEQRMRSVSPSLARRPFARDTGPARKDGEDQDTPVLAGAVSARRPGRGRRG
jgi:hypothetical protein